MKKKMITIAPLFLALLTSGLQSCGKEYVDLEYNGNVDLNQLVFTPARKAWDGGACDVKLNTLAYDKNQTVKNQVINLNLSLYQGRTAEVEATAEVFVNADSLDRAIAKVPQGGDYEKYDGVEILPADLYILSGDKLRMPAGTTQGEDLSLTICSGKIIDYIQNEVRASKKFALPISVKNATGYRLNNLVHTVVYFLDVNYVKPDDEAEYLPDVLGVGDDHEQIVNDIAYKLKWHDEFNGSGIPNPEMWRFETGFQRNEEDQWYSDKNAVMRDGTLVISAREERVSNPNYNPNATGNNAWKQTRQYAEYTSACIVANESYAFQFGRMEVRAKIPAVQGCWPAIWSTGVWYQWPFGGEIDMMEYYKDKIHANVAWGGNAQWSAQWNSKNYPFSDFKSNDAKWLDKYHLWVMDWDENFIRIYLDGKLLNEVDLSTTKNGWVDAVGDAKGMNPYTTTWYPGQVMMLNLAIGGINGRPIECSFPQEYLVDYIRIYQKK